VSRIFAKVVIKKTVLDRNQKSAKIDARCLNLRNTSCRDPSLLTSRKVKASKKPTTIKLDRYDRYLLVKSSRLICIITSL
jgi:hypothetical protein